MAKKSDKESIVKFAKELSQNKKDFTKQLKAVRKGFPLVAAAFTLLEQALVEQIKWKWFFEHLQRIEELPQDQDLVRAKAIWDCAKNGGEWEGGKCYRSAFDR